MKSKKNSTQNLTTNPFIFSVTILGSNGAVPVRDKFPSSQILQCDNNYYLIDCGEGSQFQMLKYKVPKHKINQIFISHLHGDHVFGLIALITSFHLAGRVNKLEIFAPEGIIELINVQLKCTSKIDINYLIEFHLTDTEKNQLIFEDNKVKVYSIPLRHRIPTNGFLFQEKKRLPKINKEVIKEYNLNPTQIKTLKSGEYIQLNNGMNLSPKDAILHDYGTRSYAYCSDTAFKPEIALFIRNVDLLYHETTFLNIDNDQAIKAFHSTASNAAEIAFSAHAKKLIIGHFSARYKDHELLKKEAKEIFENTEIANEGDVFYI